MSELFEFKPWPKIFRYYGPAVITEKIDGTNAAIHIKQIKLNKPTEVNPDTDVIDLDYATGQTTSIFRVGAQSRTRLITPGEDNFGFAAWVQKNRLALAQNLGEGIHFGEWYGRGINRGYGLGYRAFALFNTSRWRALSFRSLMLEDGVLTCVPVLSELDSFHFGAVHDAIAELDANGSSAVPGFDRPEGIVVYWPQADHMFKYTPFDGDGNKARRAQEAAAMHPKSQVKTEMVEPLSRLGRLFLDSHAVGGDDSDDRG